MIRYLATITASALWLAPAVAGPDLACPTSLGAVAWDDDKDTDKEKAYRVKAAFLLNFIHYTTWPESCFDKKDSPIELLIVGEDPFESVIDEQFEGKKLQGRKVSVKRAEKLPEKISAHMVFTSGLGAKDRASLLKLCAKKPILTVGETDGFAAAGAQANFYIDDNKVRFEFNTEAVEDSDLEVSSQLLKLCRIVKSEKKGS